MENDEGATNEHRKFSPADSFTRSPLSEPWLLLIISRHRLTIHRSLLLLRWVEAIHVSLLVGSVQVVMLINVHFLLYELMSCSYWRRRLHHLARTARLIRVHSAAAHNLTSLSSKLRVLRNWRRLLMNEVLRSLKAIALIAWPHHEVWILDGEMIYSTDFIAFGRFVFIIRVWIWIV